MGWRCGSVVKSTCCSCRDNSQQSYDGSQPSVTPVPWDPMPSLQAPTHTPGTHTYLLAKHYTRNKVSKDFKVWVLGNVLIRRQKDESVVEAVFF